MFMTGRQEIELMCSKLRKKFARSSGASPRTPVCMCVCCVCVRPLPSPPVSRGIFFREEREGNSGRGRRHPKGCERSWFYFFAAGKTHKKKINPPLAAELKSTDDAMETTDRHAGFVFFICVAAPARGGVKGDPGERTALQ